ncbi:MAG TPA: NEW3 domain-containing protein [Candidatus Limnocylindrales bacterium]|nr:NEW3 domain-containing protein [Candidatus Limnocylindrales bacterium]
MSSLRRRGLVSLALAFGLLPALAPAALAAGLTMTTPFPSVTVSPGTQVAFDLAIKTSNSARVNLSLSGVPSSWTAGLHGGGFVVGAVQTNGTDSVTVRLDIDVPDDASGTTTITVTANDGASTVTLPVDVKVEANAGGTVTVKPDFPEQRGTSSQSFTFNLNISNQTPEDLVFTGTAEGPTGWTTDVTLTGSATAVNGTVKAGGASNAAVKVTPAENAPAGNYPIAVVMTIGGKQYPVQLSVDVTGSYSLIVTTPNQVLSANGNAGTAMTQQFIVQNTGTAPITNVVLSASTLPTNWKATFEPATTDSIAAGQQVTITATITPSSDAVAGDYKLSFTARAAEGSDQVDIRFTVNPSILGTLLGIAIFLVAIGGLYWAFRRYGRR